MADKSERLLRVLHWFADASNCLGCLVLAALPVAISSSSVSDGFSLSQDIIQKSLDGVFVH